MKGEKQQNQKTKKGKKNKLAWSWEREDHQKKRNDRRPWQYLGRDEERETAGEILPDKNCRES